jgi:hypothetical protein
MKMNRAMSVENITALLFYTYLEAHALFNAGILILVILLASGNASQYCLGQVAHYVIT